MSHTAHNLYESMGQLSHIDRDCHGYGKTCGLEVTGLAGMGTVVNFGTPQHTTYPYHGITGIPRVYYNKVSVIFIVLKLIFSHI